MENIKRYYFMQSCECGRFGDYLEGEYDEEGDWVKYSDHKAVVETMQNKIEELRKSYEEECDFSSVYVIDEVLNILAKESN